MGRSKTRSGAATAVMVMVMVMVAVVVALLAAPAAPAAAVGQQVVTAQQRGVALGGGASIVRLTDVPLPAGGAGDASAQCGVHLRHHRAARPHRGRRVVLAPGQAAWVGDQEERTHARGSDAAGRFFFVGVFPAAIRGTVPPGIAPTSSGSIWRRAGPASSRVPGRRPRGLVATRERLYVASPPDGQVWAFDPQRGRRVQVLRVGGTTVGIGPAS